MITDTELAAMRATAETAMPDTCTVTRATAGSVDDATGVFTPGTPTTLFTGACRVRQYGNSQETVTLVGDLDEVLSRYVVTLPASATGIEVNDVVTVTTSHDADVVDRPLNVAHVPRQSWQLERRLVCEDRANTSS